MSEIRKSKKSKKFDFCNFLKFDYFLVGPSLKSKMAEFTTFLLPIQNWSTISTCVGKPSV